MNPINTQKIHIFSTWDTQKRENNTKTFTHKKKELHFIMEISFSIFATNGKVELKRKLYFSQPKSCAHEFCSFHVKALLSPTMFSATLFLWLLFCPLKKHSIYKFETDYWPKGIWLITMEKNIKFSENWKILNGITSVILTFWNSGTTSFSSKTITLIGTWTKLSCSESPPDALTLSLIVTRKDNVSFV